MSKYRIVKVPQEGKKDKYDIQICVRKNKNWWDSEKKIENWHGLNSWGGVWYSRLHGPSSLQLPFFDSQNEAEKYLEDKRKYKAKKSEVVFETDI